MVPFPYSPHEKEDRFTFASPNERAMMKTAFGQRIPVAHLDDLIAIYSNFPSQHAAGLHRQIRMLALQRLNPGQLIQTDRAFPLGSPFRSFGMDGLFSFAFSST